MVARAPTLDLDLIQDKSGMRNETDVNLIYIKAKNSWGWARWTDGFASSSDEHLWCIYHSVGAVVFNEEHGAGTKFTARRDATLKPAVSFVFGLSRLPSVQCRCASQCLRLTNQQNKEYRPLQISLGGEREPDRRG